MRLAITVLALTLVQVMGLPTPEIPAVVKIPKPGINLQPVKVASKIPIKEYAFPIVETKNEPAFSLEDDSSLEVSFKSSIDLTSEISSDEEEEEEEKQSADTEITLKVESPTIFSSSADPVDVAPPALKVVPVLTDSKLIEDIPAIESSINALRAFAPSQTLDASSSPDIFEESIDVLSDEIVVSSLPVEDESIPLAIRVNEPEPPVEAIVIPAEPMVAPAVPLAVSLPVAATPLVMAVVPDPLLAPNPPMPSPVEPFIGGQYHGQDEAGQYSFLHWGGSHTRVEVKNAEGVVAGSFAYVNPDGQLHVRKYVAEPSKGFRVAASDLPSDDKVPVGDTPDVAKLKAAHADVLASVRDSQAKAKTMSV